MADVKPKYEMNELIVLRTLAQIASPCTTLTIEQTLMASGSDVKLTEDMLTPILNKLVVEGGARRVGEGFQITTAGTSDLGPLMERSLSSFKDYDDSPTGYERI